MDQGFFGPDSITWKVHSHPCMLIGGVRALLMQALNSRAMAAVDQHSRYREDPWARLIATSEYIFETTFGDRGRAEAAAEKVKMIHQHVFGVDEFSGLEYSANDPELLLWIHAAEIDSFLAAYRVYGRRLGDADADRYVAEMVRAAELIGLDGDDVPKSVDELTDYLEGQEMVASPVARAAMRFILFPPVAWPGSKYPSVPGGRLLAIPGRLGWGVPCAAAIAILPARARKAYSLPDLRPGIPAFKLAMPLLIRALRVIAPPPPALAEVQARYNTA